MYFTPCMSRTACTEDGTHCRGCGRSHMEIERVRALTGELAQFIQEMGYENPEDFLNYLRTKVLKKLSSGNERG